MVDPLLACASLDLSNYHPRYRSLAMKYYSQAVTIIREKIAQKRVQGTEDWLLLNVLHLNLFEASRRTLFLLSEASLFVRLSEYIFSI